MEQQFNLPNITSKVMTLEAQNAENREKIEKRKENSEDYTKNYLDIKLAEGEKKKVLTIRLLPMVLDPNSSEYGSPFVHVFTHNLKVPAEISKTGFKNYICLCKTQGIDHDKFGNRCPLCELNKAAYDEGEKETDPIKKKEWFRLSVSNIPKESVIVRCIDRDHEDEGVKFWKFNLRDDKTDPYHQIMDLYNLRYNEGKRVGQEINILDVMNGVDLTVTITEGNAAPTITDGRISCPVSNDVNKLQEWIYDTKRWQDVFTAKPYEYLRLVSAGKIPWKDKASGKWVDKEEFMAAKEQVQRDQSNELQAADMASMNYQPGMDLVNSLKINDDDIPL